MFALLDTEQQKDLLQYILNRENLSNFPDIFLCTVSKCHGFQNGSVQPLFEIRKGDLYFCLEERKVCVRNQEIELTAKEFDIFALLIMNSNRVFTYEMIMDIVWHEEYDYYSRKAINNHISNLRKKLKVDPDLPEYIKSIHSVGYKFNTEDSSI